MARFYVYTLARPSGKIFYVGKGWGDRAEEHIREARAGDCHCRKCRIIRGILQTGKSVVIDKVFRTDDEREAFARERELTQELSRTYYLCNKSNNSNPRNLPLKPPARMGYAELVEYFDDVLLSKRERKREIERWSRERQQHLEELWRTARRQHRFEEAETLNREIEELITLRGGDLQFVMNL